MAKGISIPIASDTREFTTAIKKGVIEPLEGVEEALDDVARASDEAGDTLEDSLDKARKETSDFKREQQELARTIEQGSNRSFKSFSKDSTDATNVAKQNVDELGNEAKANLAETLSSFDGSVEGTIAAIQGTLGGVTAGLTGVIPIIAAAAGAAGLGLIAVAWEQNTAKAEEARAKVGELASEFIETGEVGERSIESMVSTLKALATETDENKDSLTGLSKIAKEAGLDYSAIAQAYVGNSDELQKLIDKNDRYARQLDEEASLLDNTTREGNLKYGQLIKQAGAVDELNGTLRANLDVARKAERAELDYINSGGPEIQAKVERIKTINSAYDETAGAAEKYLDKEKKFDAKKFIKDMQAREEALANYQASLATVDLSPEAKAFIDGQGFEAASAFLKGYKRATPSQQSELNRIWTEAGKDNSGEYLSAAEKGIAGKELKAPKVATPSFDAPEFMRQAQADIARRPPLKVEVEYVDQRTGKKVYK